MVCAILSDGSYKRALAAKVAHVLVAMGFLPMSTPLPYVGCHIVIDF